MDSQAPCGILHYCLRFVVVELTGRLQADHYEQQQVCCPKNGIPQACSLGLSMPAPHTPTQTIMGFFYLFSPNSSALNLIHRSVQYKFHRNGPLSGCFWNVWCCLFAAHSVFQKRREKTKKNLRWNSSHHRELTCHTLPALSRRRCHIPLAFSESTSRCWACVLFG